MIKIDLLYEDMTPQQQSFARKEVFTRALDGNKFGIIIGVIIGVHGEHQLKMIFHEDLEKLFILTILRFGREILPHTRLAVPDVGMVEYQRWDDGKHVECYTRKDDREVYLYVPGKDIIIVEVGEPPTKVDFP